MFIAAREALLALIALAGEEADRATDHREVEQWTGRRDEWTRRWRELRPEDRNAQQHILTDQASLLRDRNDAR